MKLTISELKSLIREAVLQEKKYSIKIEHEEEDKDKVRKKMSSLRLSVDRIGTSGGQPYVSVTGDEDAVKAAIRWGFKGQSGHLSVGEYFKKYAKEK